MVETRKFLWGTLIRRTLDLVYPPTCGCCGQPIENGLPNLCGACNAKLTVEMSAPACPYCANSIGPYGVQGGRCGYCRDDFRQIDGMVRAGRYFGTTAALLRAFKYHGRDELDVVLGGALADAVWLADWVDAVDALVVVPTHWRRMIGRPYYAPALLAGHVSKRTRIPMAPLLRRVAGGPHQFEVPRSQRVRNIRGKFAMARGARVDTDMVIHDV